MKKAKYTSNSHPDIGDKDILSMFNEPDETIRELFETIRTDHAKATPSPLGGGSSFTLETPELIAKYRVLEKLELVVVGPIISKATGKPYGPINFFT